MPEEACLLHGKAKSREPVLNPINADHKTRLLGEEARMLGRSARSALVAATLGGLIMLLVMWDQTSPAAGIGWLALHLAVLGLRGLSLRAAFCRPDGPVRQRWRCLVLGILATGVTWGLAGVVFFAAGDPAGQTLLGLLLVAVVGGGVALNVSSLAATLAFVVPTLLPICLAFLFTPEAGNRSLGVAGMLLVLVVILAARRLSLHLADNHALRLQIEERSRELAASQQKLALHVEQTPLGVIDWDQGFRVVGWNPAAERIFGYSESQALGLHALDLVPEEDRPQLGVTIEALTSGSGGANSRNRNQRRDGSIIHCDWFNTPLVTESGAVIGVTSLVQDISEQESAERALRASEAKFRNLVERSLAGVYMIRDGSFIYVNPMLARIFGYRADEIIGRKTVADLVAPGDRATVLGNIRRRLDGEVDSLRYQFRGQRKDGSPVEVEALGTRAEIEGGSVILGTLLDISEAVRARDRIEHLANFDPLTDLPNRHAVSIQADRLIAAARERGQELHCLYIDLDRFKDVNDTLGHDIGDRLLKEAAQRMRRCLRAEDMLARMGGDEFTVLLPDLAQAQVAAAAQRLIRTLSEPFSIGGRLIRVGASIGAARLEAETAEFNELWKRADIAMYRAKRRRGTFAFFAASQETELAVRVRIENDLQAAIDGRQLSLHYQPRVDLLTGASPSVEALVRWQHPELGWISPGDFVPIAEASGMIHRLGAWVLRHSCEQLREWRAQGLDLRVAVNLSVVELQQRDAVSRISRALGEFDVRPDWLEFEITESAAMEDPRHTVEVVSQLRRLGIAISIDDFGTGYSSLNYLKRIPANHLKIDQSFVRGIDPAAECGVDRDIVRAIIALAQSLGMETIAEGVETPEQREVLLELGCRMAQGYLISRPLPAEAATAWLRRSRDLKPVVAV